MSATCSFDYDEMTIDCTYEIGENQRKLHEYFTELSKLFGFNETELLSLYELPGMLADGLDYAIPAQAYDKTQDDNLLGDIPQAYLYSTCKEREHIQESFYYKDNFKQCKWQEDELNETGIYSFSILHEFKATKLVITPTLFRPN